MLWLERVKISGPWVGVQPSEKPGLVNQGRGDPRGPVVSKIHSPTQGQVPRRRAEIQSQERREAGLDVRPQVDDTSSVGACQ